MEQICEICNGSGEVSLPCHVLAGEIIDEETINCICKKGSSL